MLSRSLLISLSYVTSIFLSSQIISLSLARICEKQLKRKKGCFPTSLSEKRKALNLSQFEFRSLKQNTPTHDKTRIFRKVNSLI